MFRRLFGPSQSLILLFDHLSGEAVFELREQIEEVRKYYRFAKLSDVVGTRRGRNESGMAVVAFRNARKSLLLQAVPFLVGEEIPITVFLRPDCIGLNRLPLEEELAIYHEHHPDRVDESEHERYRELAWHEPAATEAFLDECRRKIGPLPLDKLDPTQYFSTWGKLLALPSRAWEPGLHLSTSPANRAALEESMAFVASQVGARPRVAFSPRALPGAREALEGMGISALVTPREGAVDTTTDPWDLPVWTLEKS